MAKVSSSKAKTKPAPKKAAKTTKSASATKTKKSTVAIKAKKTHRQNQEEIIGRDRLQYDAIFVAAGRSFSGPIPFVLPQSPSE